MTFEQSFEAVRALVEDPNILFQWQTAAASDPHHLCHHCQQEELADIECSPSGQPHGLCHDVPAAFEAALAHCPFFVWLSAELVRSGTPLPQLQRSLIFLDLRCHSRETKALTSATVAIRSDNYAWTVGDFYTSYDRDPMPHGIPWKVDPDLLSLENSTFDSLRSWLSGCLDDHSLYSLSCGHREWPSRPCPTRLLDVRLPDNRYVSLRAMNEDVAEHYMALSYCWGFAHSLQTTRANLSSHINDRIPVARLPLTIQHAVHVCRGLHIPYLWVDRLCIVQDDLEEKNREISKMCSYYRNSTVTLAAASANSSVSGFLHPEPGYNFPTREHGTLRLGHRTNLWSEPIHQRAWTYQEALLSTRLITFGEDIISWSCRQETRGFIELLSMRRHLSKMRQGVDPKVYGAIFHDTPAPYGVQHLRRTRSHQTARATELWDLIVREYVSRSLSEPTDRLRAIAGIAEEIANLFPDPPRPSGPKYLAGLWNCSSLPTQLLWEPHPATAVLGPYLAPSWSWANLSSIAYTYKDWGLRERHIGRDSWTYHRAEADSSIVSFTSTIVLELASSPFGAVAHGALTIEAPVFRARLGELGEDLVFRADGIGVWARADEVHFIEFFGSGLRTRHAPRGLALEAVQREREGAVFRRIGTFYSLRPSEVATVRRITIV